MLIKSWSEKKENRSRDEKRGYNLNLHEKRLRSRWVSKVGI